MTEPGIVLTPGGQSGARALIAVVDDDASVRKAVARLLGSSGFVVETFASATEFLERPHVRALCLVAEIHLHGMSGLDLKQRLASSERDLPVIFVTALDDPQIRARAAALGAAGYLEKPFDGEALLEVIIGLVGIDLDG